jgi:hypothetical protein
MLRWLQVLLALALASSALAQQPLRTFTQAEFVVSGDERPPGEAAGWQTLTLPHRWSETGRGSGGLLWYRIRFDLAQAPRAAQAINIAHWRSQWVDLYVNGVLIGSSRDVVSGGVGLGTPLYLTIPPTMLRAGPNELHARMRIADPIQGLGRVDFGDARPVRRISIMHLEANFYAQRAFLAMMFAGGLIALFVWFARRRDGVMLWFSVVTLSWALVGAVWNAVRWFDLPVLNNILFAYMYYGLPIPAVILALRTADIRRPKLEALLWTFLAAEVALRAFWPMTWPPTLSMRALYVDSLNAALLVVGAALVLLAPSGRLRWSHRVEAAALVAMALLLLFEVLRYGGWVDVESAVIRAYHVPVMLLAIGAAIFERHVLAVREAERTNVELQRVVDAKAREIETFHAEREEVLRRQALIDERQRILADMHDGVGASLVGLMRYAQAGTVEAKVVEQRAREAMQELRIAVDALEPAEGDLGAVLGNLRYRMQPLVESTGARLGWEVGELPPVRELEPAAVFSIQRILLEAISNALQHSGARLIRLSARSNADRGIEIRVADDGAGYDSSGPRAGLGLGTMRARAEKLGGALDIASRRGEGTTVCLTIPCQLAPA